MAMAMVLRRMKVNVTVHGFRSSFRDWVAEETDHSAEVAEMALAHTIRNQVEAAYRRGDLLSRRKALMKDWQDYCYPEPKYARSSIGTRLVA
jgi:integrase